MQPGDTTGDTKLSTVFLLARSYDRAREGAVEINFAAPLRIGVLQIRAEWRSLCARDCPKSSFTRA
jgi:hypothetical protein